MQIIVTLQTIHGVAISGGGRAQARDIETDLVSVDLSGGGWLQIEDIYGITEAFNDKREMFGKERLQALIRQQAHLAPKNLVAAVRREVETFTGGIPLEDDATLPVLKAG